MLLAMLASIGCMAAQPGFRVRTKVVQLAVTVTGRDGRSIDGLRARDFRVLDNGAPQPVTVDDFTSGLPAISLVAAVQTAGISKPALVSVRRIGGMLQPLIVGARGEVAVMAFDSRVRWLQDFTRADDQVRAAIKNLKPESGSEARMLDAVAEAADHLRDRKGRKILLLIGETRDRGSETKFEQALDAVERQGIQVYAAHYSAYATSLIAKSSDQPDAPPPEPASADPEEPPNPPPDVDIGAIVLEIARHGKKNVVKALTLATGGADFPFTRERGIENAIQLLGAEVHSQYLLSYPQPKGATGWRQIAVSIPGHPDLATRARRGYFADQSEP